MSEIHHFFINKHFLPVIDEYGSWLFYFMFFFWTFVVSYFCVTSNQKINTFLTYLIRKTAETSNPISSMQLQNYIGHILRWIDLGVDVILYLSGKVYLPKAKYFFRSQSVIPVAFWSLIRKFGPHLPKPSFIGKFPGHELDRFLENRQFYSFWAWHRQISGNLIQNGA